MRKWIKSPLKSQRLLLISFLSLVVVLLLGIVISVGRELTPLETGLLQLVQLAIATIASYAIAKNSTKEQAKVIIEERATLALRRARRLLATLTSVITSVETHREFLNNETNSREMVKMSLVENSLADLSSQIDTLYGTGTDLIDDWAEVAPEELRKIKRGARERN